MGGRSSLVVLRWSVGTFAGLAGTSTRCGPWTVFDDRAADFKRIYNLTVPSSGEYALFLQ